MYWSETKKGRTFEARCPGSGQFFTCGSRLEDAKKKRAELMLSHVRHESGGNPSTPVSVLIEVWREQHGPPQVRPSTMATYEKVVKNHIEPKWGKHRANQVTPNAVSAWLASLPLADTSLVRAVFVGIMGVAVDQRMLSQNPVAVSKRPKRTKEKVERYALQPGEMETLLAACPKWLMPVVEVGFGQALRLGEVAGLRWGALDFTGRKVTVDRQRYPNGSYGPPKTKAATIPMTPRTRDVLLPLWIAQGQPSDGAVFPCGYRAVEEAFRRVAKRVEFGGHVSFHTLRHSAASAAANSGVPLKAVSTFLRHASVSMTERYVHHVQSDENDIRIGEALGVAA